MMLLLKVGLMIVFSPLVSGMITKIKNNLRMRKGPSIFQPYLNLFKYFLKSETISEHASWVFRVVPYVVFSSTIAALFFLRGDFLTLIFLLALGRFFLALGGLDPASAFSGMGSSREMFISSFVEPVLLLALFAVALPAGTTNLSMVYGAFPFKVSTALAATALFLAMLAETARIPIDNQETHLELTMVHEAMVLEYSGRSLALLELAAYVKQLLLFALLAQFIFVGAWPIVLLVIALVVAIVELSVAKMRLFRVVDFLAFAGILAVLSLVGVVLGV